MNTSLNTRINKVLVAGLAGLMLLLAQPAVADVLTPFKADYKVIRGSLTLGEGSFTLKHWGGRDDCYNYHGVAKPRTLLRFLVGDITDDSYFCSTPQGDIQTQQYNHTEASDAEDTHVLLFDWKNNSVTYQGQKAENGEKTFPLPADAVDPNDLHIAVRLWLAQLKDLSKPTERVFAIVDETKIKRYTLAISPGGVIKTPIGSFDTIKIERIDKPDKTFKLWAATRLDFLPIRVESQKRDDPVIRLDIQALHGELAEQLD